VEAGASGEYINAGGRTLYERMRARVAERVLGAPGSPR